MQPEKKTFKNPVRFWSQSGGHDRTAVEHVDGVDYFPEEHWDVEITFTRKVKPIPNGTVATRALAIGSGYYRKGNSGTWQYHSYLGDLGSRARNQDDSWYRENTKPLTTGEWD
jgi:hypothetical protein